MSKQIVVRLSFELHQRLVKEVEDQQERNTSWRKIRQSDVVRQAIDHYIDHMRTQRLLESGK